MRRGEGHPLLLSIAGPGVVALAMAFAWPPAVVIAADADGLIREGVTLRRQGDDAGALQRFQQAFQIDKSPRVVAQIGLAEQALGRWAMAHEHLSEALNAKPDPWMAKNRAAISEALNVVNDHVGRIEILGGSPKAEVRIDGVLRGTLPLARALTLSTGTVTVDLTAPGMVPVQRTTMIRARQTVRESFDPLAPIPGRDTAASVQSPAPALATSREPTSAATVRPVSASESAPPGAVEPSAGTPGPEVRPPSDAASESSSALRTNAKWIAWGLGGATLGLGVFGLVRQNGAADDFEASCQIDPMGMVQPQPGSSATVAACRGFQNGVDSNFRLEVIGFVSAGVLAAAGFVLWLTEPSKVESNSVAWGCVPSVAADGGLAMGCRLRF